MAINSRAKGASGERELAKKLKTLLVENGIENLDPERSQQFCGASGDADVRGLPGVHVECKRVEKLNLDVAFQQAEDDHKVGTIPVVVHRKNRKEWKCTLTLHDFMRLYSIAYKEGYF